MSYIVYIIRLDKKGTPENLHKSRFRCSEVPNVWWSMGKIFGWYMLQKIWYDFFGINRHLWYLRFVSFYLIAFKINVWTLACSLKKRVYLIFVWDFLQKFLQAKYKKLKWIWIDLMQKLVLLKSSGNLEYDQIFLENILQLTKVTG